MARDMMGEIAAWWSAARERWPGERLALVLDIDGTLLDPRASIHYTLQSYDREHGTRHFWGATPAQITAGPEGLEAWLDAWPMPADARPAVARWVRDRLWSPEVLLAAARPYEGVLDVLRWLQLQPHTQIALHTSRPESLRSETLRALHAMGAPWRVRFPSHLLAMSPFGASGEEVVRAKSEALRELKARGLRPVIVMDSDAGTLEAMRRAYDAPDAVLWVDSTRLVEPGGGGWDITRLTSPEALAGRMQLAWHGVHDEALLARFLESEVTWAEGDVRFDAMYRLALGEGTLALEHLLEALRGTGRGVKLDLWSSGVFVDRLIALLERMEWPQERLWFHGALEVLGEQDFRRLSQRFPGAILQTQVDFLGPMLHALPRQAHAIVETLQRWGVTRCSVGWSSPAQRVVVEALQSWDVETNVWAVPDRRAFLQAALLTPDSITAPFHAM